MFKSVIVASLAIAASAQYQGGQGYGAPQGGYGGHQGGAGGAGAPGPLLSFSNSITHTPQQAAAGGHGGYSAPQAPAYQPQQHGGQYGGQQGGYNYGQAGAHNAGAGQGFGDLGQLSAQNPAAGIPVPQAAAGPAGAGSFGGHQGYAPQPAAHQQYAAPQGGYGGQPAGGAGGNPYGGPFSYSNSVNHAVSGPAPAAAPAHGAPQGQHQG